MLIKLDIYMIYVRNKYPKAFIIEKILQQTKTKKQRKDDQLRLALIVFVFFMFDFAYCFNFELFSVSMQHKFRVTHTLA